MQRRYYSHLNEEMLSFHYIYNINEEFFTDSFSSMISFKLRKTMSRKKACFYGWMHEWKNLCRKEGIEGVEKDDTKAELYGAFFYRVNMPLMLTTEKS